MNSSVELSVFRLIMGSSLFIKLILLLLFLISNISWAIILHRYFFLNRYKSRIAHFLKTLTSQANPRYIEDSCTQFSTGYAKTIPIILLRLIRSHNQGRLKVPPDAFINNAVMHEANKLKKGMGLLATAANISPLIGLLGTVWGVMSSFINIGREGSANIAAVAPGIAEALITTIAGLCVAIPAMVGHNFLTGWIDQCLDYLDRISEYALSILQ